MKRILTLLMAVLLMVQVVPSIDVYGASPVTVLAFTSDAHNKDSNLAADRLNTWLDKINGMYGKVDVMGFCGDMAGASTGTDYWSNTEKVMKVADGKVGATVYTTGNHEYSHKDTASMYAHDLNDVTRRFTEDSEAMSGKDFAIYCVGCSSYMDNQKTNVYNDNQISRLSAYLHNADNDKPIIILTHYPLHFYSYRTITNADRMIDTINTEAVGDPEDKSDDKKIVLLWGHNHTEADSNYDQIYKPGDSISYAQGKSKPIKFYYGAAGCMSDEEYSQGSASVQGKGLVITIDSNHLLTFAYYGANGANVTEGGTFVETPHIAENVSESMKPILKQTISDPYGVLIAKMVAKGKKSLDISWNAVKGATGYDVFMDDNLIQSVKDTKWTAKGLKKNKPYKVLVRAYTMRSGAKSYIKTSPVIYAYTSGGTKKYTNPKSLKVKKAKVKVKKGKTYKIKATVKKLKKSKKFNKDLAPKLRYISNNTSVAKVSKSGVITAKGEGNCTIYVFTANGIKKKVTVTVRK